MKLDFDVLVVGSGPAGMTASIYLKRANVSVAMIDAVAPGGQVNRINKIENYLGFTEISGPTLAYNMFMQTQQLGITYKYGKVLEVIDHQDYKTVKTDKEEITCKSIIIATGRKPKELGLPNEKNLVGRGISWCAICDGPLFKNKEVVIVGGGNSALEESLYLKDIASKVTILLRSDKFRGDQIFQDRVLKEPKIEVLYNNVVTEIKGEKSLESLEVTNNVTNEKKIVNASGLFIYIGFEPAIDMFKNLNLDLNHGYIVVDNNMRTNVKNVFACGDVISKELYQIATAIGEGAIAAISAIRDLER